jgi:hypothetical protein
MLSNETDRSSSGQMTAILNELNILANSGGNVAGYAYNATWDTLEPTKGNYDFSHIDNILNHLPSGKKLIIGVQSIYAPSNHIPTYILTDSAYGSSNAGGYGYWTGYGGASYIGAKWRSSVMSRWIALFQALGDRYDSDSRVVALIDRDETAPNMDGGSDYSDSAMLTQWTNFGSQVVAHAPHMSVVQQINWLPSGNERSYMAALYQNRAGFGGPDIFGASIGVNYVAAQAIYDGNSGGVDYRGKMPMIHDVQSPEMTGGLGLYSPTDIVNNANGNLGINYMLWCYLGGGGAGDWYNQVLPAINAHPISRTACPSSYGSCSAN